MHLRARCLVAAYALTLPACAEMPSGTAPASGDTWVILAPGAPSVRGTWTPSSAQVLAARAAAKRHLERVAETLRSVADAKWRLSEIYPNFSHWFGYPPQ